MYAACVCISTITMGAVWESQELRETNLLELVIFKFELQLLLFLLLGRG